MSRSRGRALRLPVKASWLAFFLVAFGGLSCCDEQESLAKTVTPQHVTSEASQQVLDAHVGALKSDLSSQEYEQALEASRAYKMALQTLRIFNSPQFMHEQVHSDVQSNAVLSSLFPNQQGPAARVVRTIYKLRQQWLPRILPFGLGREGWMSVKKKEELKVNAIKVVDLLEHAIELGNSDAMYKLADISMFSPSPLLHNVSRAVSFFEKHAETTGNGTSHAMLGFLYSSGYENVVPVDQAQALLHYTFGGLAGDKGAMMSMGYRYWAGIGVNDDCMEALEWYQIAAQQSMTEFLSGPPGGKTLPHTVTRLSDLAGGPYGLGASVASTGIQAYRPVIKAAAAHQAGENWDDVLEYYVFNAERGELDFAFRLGKIFYQGSIYSLPGGIASGAEGVGAITRDYARAAGYFLRIAREVWPQDNTAAPLLNKEKYDDAPIGFAAPSAGYLGRMFLRGEGVKQDFRYARMWFERGAEYGEGECHNGLGIIWRDGLIDGKKDLNKASFHFTVAAGQELAEAQVNLGKLYYERGEPKLAMTYFENAVRHGSPFEAYYYLAELHAMNARKVTTPSNTAAGSCAMAVSLYKLVAERGTWSENLIRDGELRWRTGNSYYKNQAMLRWWIAAERGYEPAQNNIAYVLDQNRSLLRLTSFAPSPPSNDTARLALVQWTRSAAQRNIDSLVKVGDYYFHGLGVPEEPEVMRWEKAATYYQSAAQTQLSAVAMWNLGWMYENGIGVPQDFHLAKRHYDMALNTNSEAYLPVFLSLIKLHIRSIWHTLSGGKDGLTLWASDDEREVIDSNVEAVDPPDNGDFVEDRAIPTEEPEVIDDGQWYMGRAKDEHNRRRKQMEMRKLRGDADDPIQWAIDRRNAEADRDNDYGPDDYLDNTLRGGRRDAFRDDREQEEEEFLETMMLVFFCMLVSGLIYFRGRWVERRRREEEERRRAEGQQPVAAERDNGVFPARGDPARGEWLILR